MRLCRAMKHCIQAAFCQYGAASPAWGVTPARGIETVAERRSPSGATGVAAFATSLYGELPTALVARTNAGSSPGSGSRTFWFL